MVDSADAAQRVSGGQHPDTLTAVGRGEKLQTCRERAPWCPDTLAAAGRGENKSHDATRGRIGSDAVGSGQANVHELVWSLSSTSPDPPRCTEG